MAEVEKRVKFRPSLFSRQILDYIYVLMHAFLASNEEEESEALFW